MTGSGGIAGGGNDTYSKAPDNVYIILQLNECIARNIPNNHGLSAIYEK